MSSASFSIAEVPAPGTFALSLLALGGMFFARKRVKS
ncbi:MAG: PEP-CTERM sorting domain-containing protein [Pseudomonadota bacterium]